MPDQNITRALDSARPNTLVPALITFMLAFCLVGSALSVVYTTHKSRLYSMELQRLKKDQRQLQLDWGRLLLERSAWSSHDKIWALAHNQLNMHEPKPSEWVIVTNGE